MMQDNPKQSLYSCSFCKNQRIELFPGAHFIQAKLCSHCLNPCPLCQGDGYLQIEDDQFYIYQEPCVCSHANKLVTLWNQSFIPNHFFNASFELFNMNVDESIKQAFATAKAFVKHFNYNSAEQKGLLFLGDVGIGKTYLACCILKELLSQYKIDCLFQEFTSLIRRIKSEYDKGVYETKIIEQLTSASVLVIDELGKGRLNEWELQILDSLISERYNNNKITIITTNYQEADRLEKQKPEANKTTLDQSDFHLQPLPQRVTTRVYSRLKEMCDFVYMKGDDFRSRES